MPRTTILSHILDALASQRRVVAADWRFHVLYMQTAREHSLKLPDRSRAKAAVKKLLANRDIVQVQGVRGVYQIVVPFASTLPAPDEIKVQEANPFAVFGYFTALAYHELTTVIVPDIYVINYPDSRKRIPLGTTPDDWIDIPRPPRRTPDRIENTTVKWTQTKRDWDFGEIVGHVQGYPIYVTDLERTLLDSLRFPEKCGGVLETFRAWKTAVDRIQLDVLIEYVGRFNQTLLRQRVGFVLELLGLSHPRLDEWAAQSVRGSSAKLVANREFSSHYSKRWNLSLNMPDSVLSELQG